MAMNNFNLIKILNDVLHGSLLEKNQIKYLLSRSEPEDINLILKTARDLRTKFFGTRIFLYGFLYFSTFCRNDCCFCQYRQSNKTIHRYRKTQTQILAAAREMAAAGVHLIDLTMGEDLELYASDTFGFEQFVDMVKTVQNKTQLPVMISPGTLPDEVLVQLAQADVTWYALYQETHNKALYKTLRLGQRFEKRVAKKQLAKNHGMLIEEGILTGVGETLEDLADSIIWMRDFGVDQARVMTFVPQTNTPMAKTMPQNNLMEQKIIAVMRLVLPDRLIPASLDVDGLDGLQARLDAGANVVTSIVPPLKNFAGVANHSLDIENSRRTLPRILPILETCGVAPASSEEYLAWTDSRQKSLKKPLAKEARKICS